MFLRMVYDEKLAQAAYIIGCQRTGQAIVFDPERDVDRYLAIAAANGLRIAAVAETHIHADFLSGARQLAQQHGATAYVSADGGDDWQSNWAGPADKRLHDGDVFSIGAIEFRAIHTPGHTPEHMCYVVTDRGGGASEPIGVITGDFVFVGDLGRPDLLESAAGNAGAAAPSARALFDSIRKFVALPDFVQVWPAHGAGSACGKALGAVPQSTVGYEKRFNPAIAAAKNADEFTKFILAGQPEPPLYFARMKRDNRDGPRVLAGLPNPPRIDHAALGALDAGRVAIIDTRPWSKFRDGHIPGSFHLPLVNTFPTDAGSLLPDAPTIYLIVDAARRDEAIRDLVRIGFDDIAGWTEPASVTSYADAGGKLATIGEIAVATARRDVAAGTYSLLDVRRAAEFAHGHIDAARNISHTRLASRLSELPKNRKLLVNCMGGSRSARACAMLQREGFDVTNLAGGYDAWTAAAP